MPSQQKMLATLGFYVSSYHQSPYEDLQTNSVWIMSNSYVTILPLVTSPPLLIEAKRLALWAAWSEPPDEGASEGGWIAGGGGGGGPPPAGGGGGAATTLPDNSGPCRREKKERELDHCREMECGIWTSYHIGQWLLQTKHNERALNRWEMITREKWYRNTWRWH